MPMRDIAWKEDITAMSFSFSANALITKVIITQYSLRVWLRLGELGVVSSNKFSKGFLGKSFGISLYCRWPILTMPFFDRRGFGCMTQLIIPGNALSTRQIFR